MKFFYSDRFVLPLPDGHRFPMSKYSMLRERLQSERVCKPDDLMVPSAATDEELLRAHTPEYLRRVVDGELTDKESRRIGFPWTREMVERCRRTCGGTLGAARIALEENASGRWGVAGNLAGGTHHSFAHRGEGFCVFNDAPVAARALQAEGLVEKVVVVDTDVHQGNGTASILDGDDSVFTFSIHGAKNFPFNKERSDLDVELDDKTEDEEYIESLKWGLEKSLSAINADIAIFLAGADPFEGDRFGRMSVTKEGLMGRDRIVLDTLRESNIPTVITMAGGYAKDVNDTVDIHFNTMSYAAGLFGDSADRKELS